MDSVCLILWKGWQMYEFVQYNCIYENQGWEFALSLICSLLFRSKSLILKRELLASLFKTELYSMIDSLVIQANHLQKTSVSLEKFIFFICF